MLFFYSLHLLSAILFVIVYYVFKTSIDQIKENSFTVKKGRSRRYPTKTITDADDLALLANAPIQAKSLRHSQEQASRGIGLHGNADKTECRCFHREGAFSTLNGSPQKLVDMFAYHGSSVSSLEIDISMA